MTILTSKNLPVGPLPPPEKETDEGPSAASNVESTPPAAAPSGGDDMKEVFILDNAPVAEPGQEPIHSKPGIYLTDGSEMTIEVVDGRYVLDEEGEVRRRMLKDSLLKAGFRQGPTFPGDEEKEPKKESKKKPAKAREKFDHAIELMHPDNTSGNLINATVRAAGKRVKIKDGIVTAYDLKVVEALQRKGYIIQNPHTLERELDPDGDQHPPPSDPEAYAVGDGPHEPEPDAPQGPGEREDAEEPIAPDVDGEGEPDGTDG